MRTSVFLALVLTVAACRGRVQGPTLQGGRPPFVMQSDAQDDLRGMIDAIPMPLIFQSASKDLRKVVTTLHGWLASVSWSDWQIIEDGPHRQKTLAWLARDFRAPIFMKADRVEEALLQAPGPLHSGVFILHFQECKSLNQARAGVARVKRSNFEIPVLTVFRTKAHGHSLIFILSETPLHAQITALFKELDAVIGPDTDCVD